MSEWRLAAAAGLFLAFWVLAASALSLWERRRSLGAQPLGYYGMIVAHCGVAALVAGVTLVNTYETERHARMAIGETVGAGGYLFRFDGAAEITGPNYRGVRGRVEVLREGRGVATLQPEKRVYNSQQSAMTEAAIASGVRGDLYVALDEPLEGGAWTVRVYVKPFVTWIWGGALLMALGGLLAIGDRRYRLAVRAPGAIEANRAVLRHQLAELDADLRAGTLAPAQYGSAKLDIDRRALEETPAGQDPSRRMPRWASIGAGLALPVLAVALYLAVGNPAALAPPKPVAEPVTREQLEVLVARLAARLEREPNDAQGWGVLALSYYTLQRFPEAASAYARLAELKPGVAAVLADQADALSLAQGRKITGAPLDLAHRALAIDPKHWKALALVASEAFSRKDYPTAIAYWERLQTVAPADSPVAKSVVSWLEEARQLAAKP
jgi:cytochrome c-type biogenesis protein CcmI